MEELELNRINANSPYIVELDFSTGLFKFVSDFGVSFSVAFEKDELLQSGESYQFALTNYVDNRIYTLYNKQDCLYYIFSC